MTGNIENVRALLRDFRGSEWCDFHVRANGLEVYFTRGSNASSPMQGQVQDGREPACAPPAQRVCAPHLGVVEFLLADGSKVDQGDTVAEIRVLDRLTKVFANCAGTAQTDAQIGDLVEYDAGLLIIRP